MKTEVRMILLLSVVAIVILSLSASGVPKTTVRAEVEEKVTLQPTHTPVTEQTKTIVIEPTTVSTLAPAAVTPLKKYPWGKNDTSFGTGELPKLGIKYPIKTQEFLDIVVDREAFVIHKAAWETRNSVVLMIHNRGEELELLNAGDIFVINSPKGVFTYTLLKKEIYTKIGTTKYESVEKEVINEGDLAFRIYVKENQGLVLQSCIPSKSRKIEILFLTFKRVS